MAIEDGERSEFEGTLEYVAARWREADRGTLRHAFPLLARGHPVAPESHSLVTSNCGQMQGRQTQAMLWHRRGWLTPQMPTIRRNPSGDRGLRADAASLLVDDAKASPPPRSLPTPRKTLPRDPSDFNHGLLDANGALSELFGVMQAPTLHRVEVEGRAGFTCCAVVAHTLPALVDQPVTVESVDPLSRRVIKLRLSPDSSEHLQPSTAVVCFPTTLPEADLAGVRDAFCSHIKHFADRASAQEFASLNSRRQVVSVVELHALARQQDLV